MLSAPEANTLLALSAAAVVIAPLAGVACASPRQFVTGTVLWALSSGALVWTLVGIRADVLPSVAAALLTLVASSAALGTLGLAARSMLRDPLDAAAVSCAVGLAAGFGILVIGPAAARLPGPAVNAALAVSPVVATLAAADVDILRSRWLYHVSPIAHRQFDYPSWYAAATLHGCLALAGLAAARLGRFRPTAFNRYDFEARTS